MQPDSDLEGVVLDRRGDAQRESDEIRDGFSVYRRLGEFIQAERYKDLGYATAVKWWQGERIGEHNKVAEADRKKLVQALTGAGMSIRATGAMLAISPAQAQRDKTGKPSNKKTTRRGRKKASPHDDETAGQGADGGETQSSAWKGGLSDSQLTVIAYIGWTQAHNEYGERDKGVNCRVAPFMKVPSTFRALAHKGMITSKNDWPHPDNTHQLTDAGRTVYDAAPDAFVETAVGGPVYFKGGKYAAEPEEQAARPQNLERVLAAAREVAQGFSEFSAMQLATRASQGDGPEMYPANAGELADELCLATPPRLLKNGLGMYRLPETETTENDRIEPAEQPQEHADTGVVEVRRRCAGDAAGCPTGPARAT